MSNALPNGLTPTAVVLDHPDGVMLSGTATCAACQHHALLIGPATAVVRCGACGQLHQLECAVRMAPITERPRRDVCALVLYRNPAPPVPPPLLVPDAWDGLLDGR